MRRTWLALGLSISLLVGFTGPVRAGEGTRSTPDLTTPESVLQAYLHARYSNDAAKTYALLAAADRSMRTLEEHAGQGIVFEGAALAVASALADAIRYDNVQARVDGSVATVTFDVELPNGNDPAIRELALAFDPRKLNSLDPGEVQARVEKVAELARNGQLPVLTSAGESWQLLHEDGQWRVFENWAEALEIRFAAFTHSDLGWKFTPVRERVFAEYGETVHMAYRAENTGSFTSTGKARHLVGPADSAAHLEVVSCFCFLEQTLEPGESVELPLVLRVSYDTPDDVTRFDVNYEFFGADAFPGPHPDGGSSFISSPDRASAVAVADEEYETR